MEVQFVDNVIETMDTCGVRKDELEAMKPAVKSVANDSNSRPGTTDERSKNDRSSFNSINIKSESNEDTFSAEMNIEIKHESEASLTSEFIVKEEYNEQPPNSEEDLEEKQYKCNVCLGQFTFKSKLERHFCRVELTQSPLSMKHVSTWSTDETFEWDTSLEQPTSEEAFKCGVCRKRYKRQSNFEEHVLLHSKQKQYKCDVCLRQFHFKSKLHRHVIAMHVKKKEFQCDVCSKQFHLRSILQSHMLTHSEKKGFKCDVCSKEFRFRASFQQHSLIHSKEKRFKCDLCPKEFHSRSNLKKHTSTHSKQKLKCDVCDKEFPASRRRDLDQHMLLHSEKPFECGLCKKRFKVRAYLRRHMFVHSKDFQCVICRKQFSRRPILTEHMSTHSNEAPFECDLCKKRLKTEKGLLRHMRRCIRTRNDSSARHLPETL